MTEIRISGETESQQTVSAYEFPDKKSVIEAFKEIFKSLKEQEFACVPFFVGLDYKDLILLVGEEALPNQTKKIIMETLKLRGAKASSATNGHPIIQEVLRLRYQEYRETGNIMCLSFAFYS